MVNAGVVAKGTYGNAQFAAAVTGGTGSIDSTRMVTFPTVATAVGDRPVSYVGVTGRASVVKEMGSMYLKPSLEGAATLVSAGALTETGAGAAELHDRLQQRRRGRGTASIEIGGEIGSPQDVLFRPYVSVGATVLTGEDVDIEAGFPGLGPGTSWFRWSPIRSLPTSAPALISSARAVGRHGWSTMAASPPTASSTAERSR